MDISTALEAARAPLTLEEIKMYCGPMYSDERLENLIRCGEIGTVNGIDDVFWSIPPALRKKSNYNSRKCTSPNTAQQRANDIRKVVELRTTLSSINQEMEALKAKQNDMPTEDEVKAHIDRLHKYNDTKDEGVKILEKLANLEGVSVREIYEKYDIDEQMLK